MEQELDLNEQLKNRRQKLRELQEQGKDPFHITFFNVDAKSANLIDNFKDFEGKVVCLAGRLMTRRVMGKASFFNLQDAYGNIQGYIKADIENYEEFKKFDIGDMLGIEGEVFKTQKEEISIRVSSITLLAKSLQVLPEKYHGLRHRTTL